jgi:ADP-ribose pyrophosphatase
VTYTVKARHEQYKGPVFTVLTDEVQMPDGGYASRDYVVHIGAVGVVAIDERERIVLVHQYRHPIGYPLWELPAGLIDVEGEDLVEAAARELAEEADLLAGRWDLLVDVHTSPGFTTEVIRLYLARDLSEVPPAGRHQRHHEEAELTTARVPLDEAADMAFRGQITNAACLIGVLAAVRLRQQGWPELRPVDAPLARPELAPVVPA